MQSGIAAGLGPHLPVGSWSGQRYRSAIRFPAPSGWSSWVSVDKATLTFYISDHQHVGVRNSSIYVRQQISPNVWTKAQGTQNCNSGFSAGNNTQWDDILPNSGNQATFSSGTTANAKKTVTVTAMVQFMQERPSDFPSLVFVFDQVSSSDYTEIWSLDASASYEAELSIDYTTNRLPSQPTLTGPA